MKNLAFFMFLTLALVGEELTDWGPFYRKFKDGENEVVTGLGPFFQKSSDERYKSELTAVRPFVSVFGTDSMREFEGDLIWPLGEKRVRPDQVKWRVGLLGNTQRYDLKTYETIYSSKWIFPLIWHKQERGRKDSFFFIPFWGSIDGGFTFDESQFVLFPIYGKSRSGQTVSKNYLWPIFNHSSGGKATRYRVWPFYAYRKVDGLLERRVYMWPFFHKFSSLDKNVPGGGYFVFPFYGSSFHETLDKKKQMSTKTIMWPFYTHYAIDNLEDVEKSSHRRTFWPFYHDTENWDETDGKKKYYWPFYGTKIRPNYKYKFIAWPFWHAFDTTPGEDVHKSRYLMPFYHYQQTKVGEKVMNESRRIWPLSRKYVTPERSYHAFPALFPYSLEEVERNYAPLWTLFSMSEERGVSSFELLWGLIYSRKSEKLRHWSFFPFIEYDKKPAEEESGFKFLKGLLGYRKAKGKRYYRLFWLPEF